MPEMTRFASYLFFLAGFLFLTVLFLFLKRLLWKAVPVLKKLRLIGIFLTLSSLYICLKVAPVFVISNIDSRNDIYLAELLADVKGTYGNKHPAQFMILGYCCNRSKEDAPIRL